MPDGSFSDDAVANYMENMNDLLAETDEKANDYGVCYLVVEPDRRWDSPYYEGGTENLSYYGFAKYRADVAELIAEFRRFDSANPDAFDDVFATLTEAVNQLKKALTYDGLEGVREALTPWHGRAAVNFRGQVLDVLKVRLSQQALLVEELGRAANCYRELIQRSRGDALGLAESLKNHVGVSGGLSWGDILWVIGSIAAGVTTFGASAATTALTWAGRSAYVSGLAQKFTGINDNTIPEDTVEREVRGTYADEFVPSCREQIGELKSHGLKEAEALLEGLRQDLGDQDAMDLLVLDRPEVIGATTTGELADPELDHGFEVPDIANLKYAGAMQLPVMAQFLDDALGAVSNLSAQVDGAVGDSVVTSLSRHLLTETVTALADAFTTTRDYLYQSGEALVAIADNYYAVESANKEKMDDLLATMMEESPQDDFPPYHP